jgi:probable F420-dependent oxidoreductase
MKVGLGLGRLNPHRWLEVTEEADRLGYESIWISEHLVIPMLSSGSPFLADAHPPVPADVPIFDAFSYLAFLAGRTHRIRLGTNVFNIGLRHPMVTARSVATVDVVSGGRLLFGVGASWLREEWAALGLDFGTRGRRVNECLAVCQKLWRDTVIEHHGEFFDFGPVKFEPKPVQRPWPPILIGGDTKAALRRAAQFGDGWIPMNHSLDDLPTSMQLLAKYREEAGRSGRTEVTVTVGPADTSRIADFAAAGIDRVIVTPWSTSNAAIDGIRRFAEEHNDFLDRTE